MYQRINRKREESVGNAQSIRWVDMKSRMNREVHVPSERPGGQLPLGYATSPFCETTEFENFAKINSISFA